MSYPNGSSENKNKMTPWLIAAIVALVGTNIATFVSKNNTTTQLGTTQTELKKEEDLNGQLEQQYKDAVASLEEMKGKNTELNSLIDKQKEELATQKGKIANLINVQKNLNAAKVEMARFKEQAEGYITKIAQLENDKKQLGEQVTVLTTEKTSLQDNLSKERTAKEEVTTQKTAIEAEKAKMEIVNAELAKKKAIGAVVKASQVTIQGFHVRESGKEKERTHAKNIDRLKFCFKAFENGVVEPGKETFYLRVIDPTGVALATTAAGGGVYKLEDGKEIQYTTTKQIDFKGTTEDVCAIFDTKGNASLQKGKYLIEVYNKGYLAGKNEFDLK